MKQFILLPACVALLASCAQMHQTAQTQDGVYERPEPAVVRASTVTEDPQQSDDYYDTATARSVQQDYYDVAYNDPYYYNYDRFGFGVGLSYANYGGWGYPAYGMGMGYSWGAPMYGYGYPGYSGYGGYPGMWGYDPWYGGYYGGMGYPGYGYYGYGGGCYGCYQPVVVCGGNWLSVAPRPVLGGGGAPSGPTGGGEGTWDGQPYRPLGQRSLVNLRPTTGTPGRPYSNDRPTSIDGMDPGKARPSGRPAASNGTPRSGERSSGGWERSSGGSTGRQGGGGMPSFGSGGGGSPVISPRPR